MKKITFTALSVPLTYMLILLLCSLKNYAQETTTLQGVVKDVNGPLVGVNVWQTDTENGTETNELGYYKLQIPLQAKVTFDYIGYKPQTLSVQGNTLNITLVTDENLLDELVINAGYYTVKDKERTGSISKITSKEIGQQPVANPLAAMQGRMAGVNITQNSGVPGGGFDIQIRGRNSLRTEGNAPLYIVDGVPYASQTISDQALSGLLFNMGNVSPLNSINPNDIENIEVLKDADATAIYGSRGANGVVLITTKKGSKDRTSFSLQSTTSVSTVAKAMDLMTTEEYLKMRRDAFLNDGVTSYPSNAYDINGTWDSKKNTNWQDEFFGKKAISHNTQFSVGGGSNQTSYLFSVSHRNDETMFPGDFGYKRTNFSLHLDHRSKNDRFDMQLTIMKSDQKNHLMAGDFFSKIFLAPNAPNLFQADGNLNWENNTFDNPLAALESQYYANTNDFNSQIAWGYKLHANLKIGLNAGITELNNEEYKTIPHTIYNPAYGLTSEYSSNSTTALNRSNWIIEPKLEWSKKTDIGRWSALIGTTFEDRNQKIFSLRSSNFISNEFIFNMANGKTQQIINDSETKYRYMAVYGRLNYIYDDTYILNLTGRRDGSSRFGDNNRFGNFGAFGGAWIFSKAKIFQDVSWFSFGKIRTSYGIAGNDLIGDYQYLNNFGINIDSYNNDIALNPLRLYNPDFSWETNKKIEGAIEMEFFNGRLATAFSHYRNRSSNQLVGIPLSSVTGFTSVQSNLRATVENSGYEFTLKSTNYQTNKFHWSTDLNLSIPKNKLIAFPNLEASTYANTYVIGESTTIKKVYNYLGINKNTGLYEFEDKNGDGKINTEDKKSIGDIGVKYFGGINNHFTYNNFSIDFLWQFVKQKNYNYDYYMYSTGDMSNRDRRALDYFTSDNQDAKYQKPSAGANNLAMQAANNFRESNGVISDASFIRLKSAQVAYNLGALAKKNNSLSIYFQGYNLVTLTHFIGSDPETSGVLFPALRTYSFGFNFKF